MPPRLSFPTLTTTFLRRTLTTKPPPFPTTATCPSPTCPCAPSPSFPPTHPIDHTTPLNGVVPACAAQVLLCTGVDDWASRIEDENGGGNAAARAKGLYGPRGELSDLRYNIAVLNSSFKSSKGQSSPSAYVVPGFAYFPTFPPSPPPRLPLLSKTTPAGAVPLRDVMVLICGHGGRDLRCGVMGPLLRGEFEEKLGGIAGLDVFADPPEVEQVETDQVEAEQAEAGAGVEPKPPGARVGLISHIGGHKFAGNVIVYIPPNMRSHDGREKHALAGMGIWYGRVEPRHVEGIVRETVMAGRVVEELFRGGVDATGKMVRL